MNHSAIILPEKINQVKLSDTKMAGFPLKFIKSTIILPGKILQGKLSDTKMAGFPFITFAKG